MLKKSKKERLSVTVTGRYLERINYLVEEGIFPSRGEVFRESLRRTFRAYGLKPFTDKELKYETVKVSKVSRARNRE